MFTRIVVPLDRTECALAALPTARALAARTGATLALLHVLDHHYPSTDLADQHRRDARQWLRQVARESQPEQIPTIIAVRDGTPAEEIVTYADEIEADAICMATHARTGIGRIMIGSVAERVVHDAPLPTLLIRPDVAAPEPSPHMPIVVPLDGSPRAEAALPYATDLAKALGTPLALVRAWNAAPPIIPGPYAFEINQAAFEAVEAVTAERVATYLDGVAGRLRGDLAVETVGLHGDATEQLAAYLREERPGLVVMGTHGRGGVPRWVMGSVAIALVRAAVAPILLVGDACAHATERESASVERLIAR